MQKNSFNQAITYLFFLKLLLILPAFTGDSAAAGIIGQDAKETLKNRAEKYWNSKLTGDMITCYQLEEPQYQKRVPISVYSRTGTLVYKEVKIKDIDINDDNATVMVEIKYFIPAMGSKQIFPARVRDKWKRINGTWYHVQENNNIGTRQKNTLEERR